MIVFLRNQVPEAPIIATVAAAVAAVRPYPWEQPHRPPPPPPVRQPHPPSGAAASASAGMPSADSETCCPHPPAVIPPAARRNLHPPPVWRRWRPCRGNPGQRIDAPRRPRWVPPVAAPRSTDCRANASATRWLFPMRRAIATSR